uniref:Uncharacterized protein n=1 Tax=Knipowitschia caucasica TaxID=637954 RepID=A0AAV2KYI5_KNICA
MGTNKVRNGTGVRREAYRRKQSLYSHGIEARALLGESASQAFSFTSLPALTPRRRLRFLGTSAFTRRRKSGTPDRLYVCGFLCRAKLVKSMGQLRRVKCPRELLLMAKQ